MTLPACLPGSAGFDPLGLLDPANSGGFVEPKWLQYSEVRCGAGWAGPADEPSTVAHRTASTI